MYFVYMSMLLCNNAFFFSPELPNDWNISEGDNSNEQLFRYFLTAVFGKIFFFHFYAFQEAVNILAAAHTTIWPSDTPVGVQLSTLDWTLPVMSHFGFGLLEISTNVCRPNNVIDIKNVKNVDNEIQLSYGIVLIFWCLKIWAY